MSCGGNLGRFHWVYTGNQIGFLNFIGEFNFVGGGPKGSGISAGTTAKQFIPGEITRSIWEYPDSELTQELLNAAHPFIELQWTAEITLSNVAVFRVSDRNIYVQDIDGISRFFEARIQKAPNINITLGEWLAPNFEIGDLKLELNNRDGFFNDYLPNGSKYLQWIGSTVSIKIGFGEKFSNYYEIFKGKISIKQGVTGTSETIVLKVYDRAADDEVPIPATTFDRTYYPNVDSEFIGKAVPIIYGDWSEDVDEFGSVPATCTNATDSFATSSTFQISENALQEIGDVYLHRGDYTADKDGPIQLINSAILKYPEQGKIEIPKDVISLSKNYVILDRARAGSGSGSQTLVSDSASIDYIKLGVQIGDVVLLDNDPIQKVITAVSSGIINTNVGTFNQGDNYKIITDKYSFKKGDKISLFCKGKDLRVMSSTRISDSGILRMNSRSLSIGLDNSYWTIDNDLKKIYNIAFNNRVQKTIDFADIDPSINFISSLAVQFDGSLWLLERDQSAIYRYLVKDNVLGLTFTTIQTEIGALLTNPSALTIDEGNILTIVDNDNGQFYRINPFSPTRDIVVTFNKNIFETNANDIVDLGFDVNLNQILVLDRSTNSFYRINSMTGTLIAGSSFNLNVIGNNVTYPVGVGYFIDGTIFFLNKNDLTIYNYNEYPDCSTNIGFICRDMLQAYSGKSSFDFDLIWNETCRNNLSAYKGRVYINESVNVINYAFKLLSGFNASIYIRFQKYALFQINFTNFTTEADLIREGDIKEKSFNPSKEYNQYFNVAVSTYKYLPFTGKNIVSDVYASPSGIKMSGKPVSKTLDMPAVYQRSDLDKLIPLFVRLAAAEPEFINLTVGFRFLFAQPNTFFNINYVDLEPFKTSGRRFHNIPSFVRMLNFDLSDMSVKMKLWSLGTTQFGNYIPDGVLGGGENDEIILTNLGTIGHISPVGKIISNTINSITVSDVLGIDAESRTDSRVGLAWRQGFVVSIIDGTTHQILEEKIIDSVSGQIISFTENILTTILPTTFNSSGFIVGGHYLKYAKYNNTNQSQRVKFSYFTKPIEGYPNSSSKELEQMRAGAMKFDDQRLPYIYHPKDYIPTT